MRKLFVSALEVVEVAVIAVVTVFVVRTFLVQPFLVSGSSMVPAFSNGDYLLIDEVTYRFRPPERGEVVVFRYPGDHSTYFIKRIVGLPNERVVVRGGKVTVFNEMYPEGAVLKEWYIPESSRGGGAYEVQLKDDEYVALGDNRSGSFDSRSWGALTRSDVVGLVRLRLWPLQEFSAFAAPQY